jgi:hypothetical protein
LLAAAFPKDDATLVPKAGPCGACPKRTGNNPDLFGEVKKGDTCTDPACFKSKAAAHIDRQVAALKLPGKAVRVSEQWYVHGEEKALKSRQWALAGATTCGSIRAGIFVDGNNEGQVGKVCIDPKCKVHRPKESRSSVSGGGGAEYAERERARAQKAQAKGEHRRAIAEAILAKVAEGALARPILQLVVKGFWSDVWYEARRVLTRLHGWAGDEDRAKDPDRYRSSKLAGLSGQQSTRSWCRSPSPRTFSSAPMTSPSRACCSRWQGPTR